MNLRHIHDWPNRLTEMLPHIKPKPDTGKFWNDILFLILIAAFQFFVCQALGRSWLYIDLITPWLVVSIVRMKLLPASVLAIIAALILETHLSIPAGLYVCAYWITANVIYPLKPLLSWRQDTTWVVTIALSELFVILFELTVMLFLVGMAPLSFAFLIQQVVRLGISTLFGWYIYKKREEFDIEEIAAA